MELFIGTVGIAILSKTLIASKNIIPEKKKLPSSKDSAQSKAKKGSFLLLGEDPNSDKSKKIGEYFKTLHQKNQVPADVASVSQEVLGRQLINTRDKQMGPNVSVFYKQDGGLVITSGKGVLIYLH